MKKRDILKAILAGAKLLPGPAGLVVAGVDSLIHRDSDPTNDLEETAAALTDIAVNGILAAEGLTGKDIANDPILKQLADNVEGDLLLYVRLVRQLKPPA